MLATSGVSDVHVIVVGRGLPPGARRGPSRCASKPPGRAGPLGNRQLKLIRLAGLTLQAPKLDGAGPYHPTASFWSEFPIASPFSWTPMSTDVMPRAGPFVAAKTPS